MDAIFVDGVPAKITLHDFRRHHLYSFPVLSESEYDALIADAIDAVYAMFPGVASAWDLHRDKQIWFDKTTLCYRLLTAWYIEDRYPGLASNYTSLNGVPLESKRVDGVAMKFRNIAGADSVEAMLNPALVLRSNLFGRHALMMMQTAPRRALLRVTRFT